MINKDRENFQYKGGDLVYIISPLTNQLRTNSWKIAVKYVGPVVIYKIVERPKPTIIRTSHGNVQNLAELRQVMNTKLKLDQYSSYFVLSMVK